MNQKVKSRSYILCLAFLWSILGWAQSANYGNTYVFNSGQVTLHSGNLSFLNGSNGILPGIVGIDRTAPAGFLAFMDGTTWSDASNIAYVDGYVRTYMTNKFVFPIGDNGNYCPAAVSRASVDSPADAAYYSIDPGIAITSSLKGGNEPVLPSGGAFPTYLKDAGVTSVSTVGYWDINGDTETKITLSWNVLTDIATLTESNLNNLKIVGWNGAKWVEIPATVDTASILGGTSTLKKGSITTNMPLVPNFYSVYTLAAGGCHLNAGIISGSQNICSGADARLISNGDINGSWSSSNNTVASIDPSTGQVKGLRAGLVTFSYRLNATQSCEGATSEYAVVIEDCIVSSADIEVFNAFSPNGDGINEVFMIKGLENYPENTLEIYNRWGVKVYQTEKYGQNGNYFTGIAEGRTIVKQDSGLPVGTYFYILKYTDRQNNTKQKAGYLYLSR